MKTESSIDHRQLAQLAAKISQSLTSEVVAVSDDSRHIVRGTVFFAWRDAIADRRLYISQAVAKGAIAVVWQPGAKADGSEFIWPEDIHLANFSCADLRQNCGFLADLLLKQPSKKLSLLAVTGTNGKTSICQWLANSYPATCAYIGTLGAGLYTPPNLANITDTNKTILNHTDLLENTGFTTPEAATLTSLLARYVAQGAKACALEASSIGIEEGRLNGTQIAVAVFTNLSQDHLDYHLTMENYAAAKEKLFCRPQLRLAVINADDQFGKQLIARSTAQKIIAYSQKPINRIDVYRKNFYWLIASETTYNDGSSQFNLTWQNQNIVIKSKIHGAYNISNLLAVAGVLLDSGLTLSEVAEKIASLKPVVGRMESRGGVEQALAIVDYAHTPDALANVLAALRPVATARGGRLLCVFGCGGNRDSSKRPIMGKIASSLADQVWLTSDNPRNENADEIIAEIYAGISEYAKVQKISDRRSAIAQAFAAAELDDVILIAGKGHEEYQEIQGQKLPFSDLQEVEKHLLLGAQSSADIS